MTSMLRGKNYHKLADNKMIDVINAEASFINEHEIRLKYRDGKTESIEGKVIVINTGAEARKLILPGFEDNEHVHYSKDILELHTLPKHLVIIGAGYIGLEFSSYFTSFGAKVTVLQADDVFLAREGRFEANAVRETLEKRGVQFVFNAKTSSIDKLGKGSEFNLRVNYVESLDGRDYQRSIECSDVLVAIGRVPLTRELNLESAGVEIGKRGEIVVNEFLKTKINHIFAVGDVKGGAQFTFISLDDYRVVLPQVLAILENKDVVLDRSINNRPVYANTTFIDPPYSRIGLNEEEAKAKYANVIVKMMPAAAVPKAHLVEEINGFLKVIVNGDNDEILGAILFCNESHEMINLFTLAINTKIKSSCLGKLIYNHPVMSEILNELL